VYGEPRWSDGMHACTPLRLSDGRPTGSSIVRCSITT
jgi:hypothetical protein